MEIDGYHFGGALKRLGGDEELFQEIVRYFIEDAPGLLKALREGLSVGNADSVQRAAHSLRSLAANFDAENAMAGAALVEQMASKGDLQLVPAAVSHLEVEIQSLWRVLNSSSARSAPPVPNLHSGRR